MTNWGLRGLLASAGLIVVACGGDDPAVTDAPAAPGDAPGTRDAAVDGASPDAPGVDARLGPDVLAGRWSTEYARPGVVRWGLDTSYGRRHPLGTDGAQALVFDGALNTMMGWDGRGFTPMLTAAPAELRVLAQRGNRIILAAGTTLYDSTLPLTTLGPPLPPIGVVRAAAIGSDGVLFVFAEGGNARLVSGDWQYLTGVGGLSEQAVALGNGVYVGGPMSQENSELIPPLRRIDVNTLAVMLIYTTDEPVRQLVPLLDGRLVVLGPCLDFSPADGTCDGTAVFAPSTGTWSALPPLPDPVVAMAESGTGVLHAMTGVLDYFTISRLDGATWTPLCEVQDVKGKFPSVLGPWPSGRLPDGRVMFGSVVRARQGGAVFGSNLGDGTVVVDGTRCRALGAGLMRAQTRGPGQVNTLAAASGGTVIVGGRFDSADGQEVNNVTRHDPATGAFAPLGPGLAGEVHALASYGGQVVAGGAFDADGVGQPLARLARFDGSQWQQMGTGVDGPVRALVEGPDGFLYVGGAFTTAGPTATSGIALWVVSDLNAVGGVASPQGVSGGAGRVDALVSTGTQVIAAGDFTHAGGIPARNVAAFTSTTFTWSALGAGLPGAINTLVVWRGQLCAGGTFTSPAPYLACWDGGQWGPPPFGAAGTVDGPVEVLTVGADDRLYVGGRFTSLGSTDGLHGLAAWDGAHWEVPDITVDDSASLRAMLRHGQDLLVGGAFSQFGTYSSVGLARLQLTP